MLLFAPVVPRKQARGKTVSEFLDAMKSYDLEALAEYYSDATDSDYTLDDFSYAEDEAGYAEMMDAMKTMMSAMDYEIIDSQVDGDTAVVNVSITSIDMSAVMTTYIANAFSLAYSNLDATEDELTVLMMQAFGDAIEANIDNTVTNEAAVNLEKVDGDWKIVGDETFINAIYGGLLSAIEE